MKAGIVMQRWSLFLASCAGTLVACAPQGDVVRQSEVRDSLVDWKGEATSIRVTDNPRQAPAVWHLAATPKVDVNGGESGHTPFYRIVRAIRLSDGRIVVADGGSTSLRVLDSAGREVTTIGRPGEGPGEFRSLTFLGRWPGDTIVVADLELARVSVFDAGGRYAREVRWGNGENSPASAIVGVFDDGSYLARAFTQLGYPPPHGLRRLDALFYHLAADGTLADTIGTFPGSETWFLPTERGFRANPGLFAQTLSFATGPHTFYAGVSDTYQYMVYSSAGRPVRLVRRSIQPARVESGDVSAEKQVRLANQPANDLRASLERMLSEMPVPDVMPVFDRILVAEDTTVWVRTYSPAYKDVPTSWTVFDFEGQILAEVTMPAGLEPQQIGRDYVLGVAVDELDVERVQLYALERPSDR